MSRKIVLWLLFLSCLALLGAGATPFGALIDHIAVVYDLRSRFSSLFSFYDRRLAIAKDGFFNRSRDGAVGTPNL
jgi:hypothetical protein